MQAVEVLRKASFDASVRTSIYTGDKIQLGVIDLSQIELATEEDKRYGTDYWASLFKVSTWEELEAKSITKSTDFVIDFRSRTDNV